MLGAFEDQTLWGLFEQQAAITPESSALVFGKSSLSYAQLLAKAEHLSARLVALYGDLEGQLVGVCLQRSIDLVLAVLTINRLGGAYVALDPDYPSERLGLIISDASLTVILTDTQSIPRIPVTSTPLFCVDVLESEYSTDDPPTPSGSPETVVYVLYTSGSTGTPKGVVMPQRALLNLIAWQLTNFVHNPVARTLQFASLNFDVSFQEVFSTLLGGGTLVLVDQETRRDPALLIQHLNHQRVERLFLPFVALQAIAEEATRTNIFPNYLREVITAGEQLKVTPLLQAFFAQLENCALVNHYGPSETHVVSSHLMEGAPAQWEPLPPIGNAVPNCQLYVLNAQLQPLEPGADGELYIGGAQLADGYLNRPELTTQRFIPDFLSGVPGARLYRTGDRVRMRPDGKLEFLGRTDDQVKVRGFRVELGEVESTLLQHPKMRDAVVLAQETPGGGQELIGYVVADSTTAELTEYLRQRLPEYMIPSAYVFLASLPTTPSGKVDRRTLSMAGFQRAKRNFSPAKTPIEVTLTEIWSEVLCVDKVSVEDNFFDLGGQSLKAAQVVSRSRSAFGGVSLSVADIFENPTLRDLAAHVAMQQGADPSKEASWRDSIRAEADNANILRASSLQERVWLFAQRGVEVPAYNVPFALDIHGSLDVQRLQRSLELMTARHEILRTTYRFVEGETVQVIQPASAVHLPVIDLMHIDSELQPLEIEASAWAFYRKVFDLEHDNPLRFQLIRLGSNHHKLLFSVHHIAFDGWSMGLFLDQLSSAYTTDPFSAQESTRLTPQYQEFVRWEQLQRTSAGYDQQLAYWLSELEGCNTELELPTCRTRPTRFTFSGATHQFAIPHGEYQEIKRFASKNGVTQFMILLGAFQALLARYTNQKDFLVGTSVMNRPQVAFEETIGFFANTLLLRANIDIQTTFRDLIERARDKTTKALANQEIPVEEIIRRIQPSRDPSRNPGFQVMFVFETETPIHYSFGESTADLSEPNIGYSKFDLTLTVAEREGKLLASFEYNRDLFSTEFVSQLSNHLINIIGGGLAAPNEPIWNIDIIGDAERHRLLQNWSHTGQEMPVLDFVQRLFEAQVERTPNAPAAVYLEESLTYSELNQRANQLAHHLIALGVRPDTLVAVYTHRNLEMVIALLATLKAGAAYVPIDATTPPERIREMLRDSTPLVLLTEVHLLGSLLSIDGAQLAEPRQDGLAVIDLADWSGLTALPNTNPDPQSLGLLPDSLAYVIYTSGSTGLPKGVMIQHHGLSNYLLWALAEYVEQRESLKSVVSSSIAFDATITSLFAPLLGGHCILIIPDGEEIQGLELLFREPGNLGVVKVTPAHLDILGSHKQAFSEAQRLPTLVVGGENLSASTVKLWRGMWPSVRLVNEYGPTETVVGCCIFDLPSGWQGSGSPPIGRPIANTAIYILDGQMNPVPVGVPGELHVGGAGVARGYLNRPELTAERFVSNPFGTGRLYKTGDLVRWRFDSNIEYLGRADHQVKIRGFRVELGEIEATLTQHPQVSESVVVTLDDVPGDKKLVAYFTSSNVDQPDATELRNFLKTRLPAYMIPSQYVLLERLPLSANGKIDRKSLPSLVCHVDKTNVNYIPPTNAVEEMVVEIFASVLRVKRVSLQDDFFDLGGHSLLSLQLVSRIRQHFSVDLNIQDLLTNPTPGALAGLIQHLTGLSPNVPMLDLSIQSLGNTSVSMVRDAPFMPMHHWLANNIPDFERFIFMRLYRVKQRLDPQLFRAAVKRMVARHGALRTKIDVQQRRLLEQGELHDFDCSHVFDFLSCNSDDLEGQKHIDNLQASLQTQLRLNQGWVFQLALLRFADVDLLLFVVHHAVFDEVSLVLILNELEAQFFRNVAIVKPVQPFVGWAHRLNAYVNSDEFRLESDYWLSLPPPSPYKLWRHDGHLAAGRKYVDEIKVPAEVWQTFRMKQSMNRFDLKAFLFSAILLAYCRTTGDDGTVVRYLSHGRDDLLLGIDNTSTIGWLNYHVPVCLAIPGFRELDFDHIYRAVLRQLAAIPRGGAGAQLYLESRRAQNLDDDLFNRLLEVDDNCQIVFNFYGITDENGSALFAEMPLKGGYAFSKPTRLHIGGSQISNDLYFWLTYFDSYHDPVTVSAFGYALKHALSGQ
jgi:amino acid adenylation domain-containing protein